MIARPLPCHLKQQKQRSLHQEAWPEQRGPHFLDGSARGQAGRWDPRGVPSRMALLALRIRVRKYSLRNGSERPGRRVTEPGRGPELAREKENGETQANEVLRYDVARFVTLVVVSD